MLKPAAEAGGVRGKQAAGFARPSAGLSRHRQHQGLPEAKKEPIEGKAGPDCPRTEQGTKQRAGHRLLLRLRSPGLAWLGLAGGVQRVQNERF